ncbi:ABC-2 type transport system ATP-binding protein [Xanthobacter flavus]|uniref:ABC transporter ATP-binding protein n=1 Tax=Xanthobacter flavus TaxID=281 RepID=A0A9W6FLU6_XANFL|nr:ABC transporter ATP-binding protein [Xanthobacter flavus]MDR6331899.1 ABC-2 type transport system ATP-binding protein [Xanthobacter flavus]GLI22308.1 ABC transporter ATP-binding protein [Xanthobacter flavus]
MSAAAHQYDDPIDESPAPPLAILGLTAGYGARTVLAGVDLVLRAGTVTALVGPNGAGKSTLVRAICGRIPPRTGVIRICGIPAAESEARARIGLAPQDIALYRALTIAENLAVFARLAGVRRADVAACVARVMARTGIEERANERIDRLSGGWQRRANVAAALVGNPRLLVLDEPTVGVDAPARADLAALVQRLAADGLGILVITHDFAFAEEVAERVAILCEGRIALEGRLAALIAARFPNQRRAAVTFATPPSATGRQVLALRGLTGDEGGTSFSGVVSDTPEGAGGLIAALKVAGLVPRTIAFEAAGLDALYADVTGSDHS